MVEKIKRVGWAMAGRIPHRDKLHTDLRRPFVMGPERREAHERALRKATLYSPRRRSQAC